MNIKEKKIEINLKPNLTCIIYNIEVELNFDLPGSRKLSII